MNRSQFSSSGGYTVSIQYNQTTEQEYVYGRGSAPRAIQEGNETYEGTITLLQTEYEALRAATQAAGFKNITKAPYTITVAYLIGAISQVDVIENVKITEIPKGLAQNDKFMEIELPFMALAVREGV